VKDLLEAYGWMVIATKTIIYIKQTGQLPFLFWKMKLLDRATGFLTLACNS